MICLVDYENVSNAGLNGLESLTKNDRLIIFLKENNTFTAQTHIRLENALCKKEYIFVNTNTKNALDFQLVAYLGILVSENKDEHYHIISKDQGFDAATKFLKSRGIKVSRKTDLGLNSTFAQVKAILPEYKDEDLKTITSIIEQYKTKSAINNNIMKVFKSEKTGVIYKKIKPLLVDKT